MPRRSLDVGPLNSKMANNEVPRKTERSHEENQERAYIAASRRSDRSIEARVQSARMASEIHKKRTGKAFRINEDIVLKEEMYEEEEDGLPRSYRQLLGPHMQTPSPEMNSRVEAFLSNKLAMSALLAKTTEEWRENDINRLFAASFPNVGKQAQQLSPNVSNQAPPGQGRQDSICHSPVSPTFQSVNYQQSMEHQSRGGAFLAPPTQTSAFLPTSPTELNSPPSMQATPSFGQAMDFGSPLSFSPDGSAFTTELSPEVRMLMGGIDPNQTYGQSDPFGQDLYSQDWMSQNTYYQEFPNAADLDKGHTETTQPEEDTNNAMDWDAMSQNSPVDDSWKAFLNDTAWGNE